MDASHVLDGKKTTSLLDLPDEMILYICSFLHTSILLGLSLVCKRFNEILKKNTFIWKARINRISPYISYPLLQPANPNELFWKLSCVGIEKQTAQWNRRFPKETVLVMNSTHSVIDALLLMHAGTTCIAGMRNGSLLYSKLPSPGISGYPCKYRLMDEIKIVNNKPICDLAAINNMIYSCSSDQSVKSWEIINTGLFNQRTYKLNVPNSLRCVSSCPEEALFATGSYGSIFVFDSRQDKPIKQYRPHTKAVIKLTMNSEYILSISQDKTVSVWDQRAGRIMKSITISEEAFPTCVNMQRDWVCVGDSTAKLHLLDLKSDSELMKSYPTKHTQITGVHMTDGCLITAGSTDNTVRFSGLTDPPQPIVKLFSGFTYISGMDYLNDTLAISGTEHGVASHITSHIEVWRPRLTCSTKHQKMDFYTSSLDLTNIHCGLSSSSDDENLEFSDDEI